MENTRTTAKDVKAKINAHILSYFEPEVYGSLGINDNKALDNLREQVNSLSYLPGDYQRGRYMAEGGTFLIYYWEQRDFLNSLGINPNDKDYSDDQVFKQYVHLIARQTSELLR